MTFQGETYNEAADKKRLTHQMLRTFDAMKDEKWRTLEEIHKITGDPTPSISTRLRDLRKERFGGHTVNKRCRGNRKKGLWEYQLKVNVAGG